MTPRAKHILVVANETVVGRPLIDAVKRHADRGDVHVHVICPQNQPKHGYVIYDTHVREAAENRLKMTLALLAESGIEASGEVMDPDPYAAVMDALGDQDYDEIIISTHPQTRSGWMRQGLVDRVERVTRRPVEHVVVDLDTERDEAKRTLVVANQTVESGELIDALREMAQEEPHRFIVICPQSEAGDGARAGGNGSAGEAGIGDARRRLAHTLQLLEDAGLEAVGQVVHPDPFTAIQNALQFYAPDEVVISTFPRSRSGWLRSDLVGRVRASTSRPVRHIVSEGGG